MNSPSCNRRAPAGPISAVYSPLTGTRAKRAPSRGTWPEAWLCRTRVQVELNRCRRVEGRPESSKLGLFFAVALRRCAARLEQRTAHIDRNRGFRLRVGRFLELLDRADVRVRQSG